MLPQLFSSQNDPFTAVVLYDNQNNIMFRATECASSLGYSNSSRSIRQLVDTEYIVSIDDGSARGKEVLYIREPGLYQLIFKSTKSSAKRFQRWVFEEVLPSIRKTGVYATEEAKKQIKAIVLAILYSDTVSVEALNETHLATSAFVETFAKNRAIAKNPEIAKAFNGLIDCFTKNPIYRNEINTGYAAMFLHLDKLIDLFGLDKKEIMEEYHKNKIYPYPQRTWKSFGLKNDHSTN